MDHTFFIREYKDILPLKSLVSVIKFLNTVSFESAEVINTSNVKGGEVNKNVRNTEQYAFTANNASLTNVHYWNLLCNRFGNIINKYKEDCLTSLPRAAEAIVDIIALRYEKNGFYVPHVDHAMSIPRTLSIIFFLNNDYEGGDLVFVDPTNTEKVLTRIKTEPNKLIIWPSNFIYPHGVEPITKGIRYSIVCWAL